MSLVEAASRDEREREWQTATRLTQRCRLSHESLARIRAVMEQTSLRFADAAVHLGLVTREDVLAVQAPVVEVTGTRAKPVAELRIATDPFHRHSERVRALRTELLLRREPPQASNVLALVSPARSEGRSRLAAELAIAFSQLGQPTLLIDADLRQPRQHALFGVEQGPGLTQALARRDVPAIQSVAGLEHLFVMTAGAEVGNPLELLSEAPFGHWIDFCRTRFAHVVLDTPPASEVSDALAVATHARRVLVVLRDQRSRLAHSRELLRQLAATRAQVLGAAINYF